MSDGVSVTFDLRLRPEAAAGFIGAGEAVLQGTVGYPGLQQLRIVQHKDDPLRVRFLERWDSEDAYRAYIAWRTETGAVEAFQQVAAETQTNLWPNLIVEKHSQEPIPETEGVSITFELDLKPEMVGPFMGSTAMFETVATFPGFRRIRLVQHRDDPTRMLFIERWDSEAAYRGYLDWQTERGGMDGMRQISTRMQIDVWPTLLAHA
ncbi:antibiotic biosynthesis monooxygenase [Phenylobacterium sp. LjRoot219]|uniref:antibiotic biosynthesis monooxygenase n=1 Tax=Phenylobacterium sp. LjRoot219 TaxID=3342283 RepID=UPI003ECD1470